MKMLILSSIIKPKKKNKYWERHGFNGTDSKPVFPLDFRKSKRPSLKNRVNAANQSLVAIERLCNRIIEAGQNVLRHGIRLRCCILPLLSLAASHVNQADIGAVARHCIFASIENRNAARFGLP
ncbi:hypothetical protein QLQ09_22125 [Brucella sp. NM4]|uniref:hypothetical protein n=1 Tax=Brucella sp. NM4 TaxID=3045175 RepID=UPI0024BCEDE4|nr:hypothetical protein [Brucella sp. NM4]WHS32974.1 hypothetical protein QLQ09_22125 [Brucella sp. NM4]